MAKDPAFLFYDGDAARDVSHMNRTERGCYFDFIQAQRKFGGITLEQAKKILGKDFESCWPSLEMVLTFLDGKFFIEWIQESTEKRKVYAEKNKKRIQEYWDKKKKKDSNEVPNTFHGNTTVLPYVNEIENENAIENEIIDIKEKDFQILEMQEEQAELETYPTFEDFWEEYDKKKGEKGKLKKKWLALTQKERELIMDYIPNYKASQPEKKYRLNPETFFNNKAWNDELIFDNGKQKQTPGNDKARKWAEHFAKGTSSGT